MLLATFSPGYSMVALAQHCIRQKDCVHEGENVTVSGVQKNCTSSGSGKWGLSRYRSERHKYGVPIFTCRNGLNLDMYICVSGGLALRGLAKSAAHALCSSQHLPGQRKVFWKRYQRGRRIKSFWDFPGGQLPGWLWHQGAVMQVQDKPHALGVFSCTLGPEYMLNCTCTETAAGHTEIPSK